MTNPIDALIGDILEMSIEPEALQPEPSIDARALCFAVGAAIKNPAGYRQGVASMSTLDLAYEYAVLSNLSGLLRTRGDWLGILAANSVERLRDICTAEGIRRGLVLMAGDDVDAISLAVQIMDEMLAAFSPDFALSDQIEVGS